MRTLPALNLIFLFSTVSTIFIVFLQWEDKMTYSVRTLLPRLMEQVDVIKFNPHNRSNFERFLYPLHYNVSDLMAANLTVDPCIEFYMDGLRHYTVQLNVFNNRINDAVVTMVTHMTSERLSVLAIAAATWSGPISLSVYGTTKDFEIFKKNYMNLEILAQRTNLYVHFVKKIGTYYPVNYMRNQALKFVNFSNFVFLNDIDFLAAHNLETEIKRYVLESNVSEKQLLVIPAFELLGSATAPPPLTKPELLQRWLNNTDVHPFHLTSFSSGHRSTNYTIWAEATEAYQIIPQEYYEPYIVAERPKLLFFDERFVGRFYNKQAHMLSLKQAGFRFFVAPNTFIIHIPHNGTVGETRRIKRCAKRIYRLMKEEMNLHNRTDPEIFK